MSDFEESVALRGVASKSGRKNTEGRDIGTHI